MNAVTCRGSLQGGEGVSMSGETVNAKIKTWTRGFRKALPSLRHSHRQMGPTERSIAN